MSSWAIVALVAIVIWGVVQSIRARGGMARDSSRDHPGVPDDATSKQAELETARRELAELKDRVRVLERIATEENSSDAREQARIAAEIEALRAEPVQPPALKKEQSE